MTHLQHVGLVSELFAHNSRRLEIKFALIQDLARELHFVLSFGFLKVILVLAAPDATGKCKSTHFGESCPRHLGLFFCSSRRFLRRLSLLVGLVSPAETHNRRSPCSNGLCEHVASSARELNYFFENLRFVHGIKCQRRVALDQQLALLTGGTRIGATHCRRTNDEEFLYFQS